MNTIPSTSLSMHSPFMDEYDEDEIDDTMRDIDPYEEMDGTQNEEFYNDESQLKTKTRHRFEKGYISAYSRILGADRHQDSDSAFEVNLDEKFAEKFKAIAFSDGMITHRSIANMLAEYRGLCSKRIKQLEKLESRSRTVSQDMMMTISQELKDLRHERDTWLLINKLFDLIADTDTFDHGSIGSDHYEWRQSHRDAVEGMKNDKDGELRKKNAILLWLQEIFRGEEAGSGDASHSETLRSLAKRRSQQQSTGNIITELDMDAPMRQQKKLELYDQVNEEKMLTRVWNHIRKGNLEDAIRECHESNQHWRAASLCGGSFFHNPGLMAEAHDEENAKISGNPYRFTYLKMLFDLSSNELVSSRERAIYGALCGNLGATLLQCSDWYDYLWAHLKSSMDYEINVALKHLVDDTSDDVQCANTVIKDQQSSLGNITTTADILKALTQSPHPRVSSDANETYHKIQSYLIEDKLQELVTRLADYIRMFDHSRVRFSSHLFRFATHLVLFLHTAERLVAWKSKVSNHVQPSVDTIIKHYVDLLIETNQFDLVALYARYMTQERGAEKYAQFLAQIDVDDERQRLLEVAGKYGMDTRLIAQLVVRKNVSASSDSAERSWEPDTGISPDDDRKIRSIAWFLQCDPSPLRDTLLQGNKLLRFFVLHSKRKAAEKLFFEVLNPHIEEIIRLKSPADSDENDIDPNAIKEYHCWEKYFEAIRAYSMWKEHQTNRPVRPVFDANEVLDNTSIIEREHEMALFKSSMAEWKSLNGENVEHAKQALLAVLTEEDGWLNVEGYSFATQQEESDIQELREICIPYVTFQLYDLLFENKCFGECVQLADIVASESMQLYKCFDQSQLAVLLKEIAEAEIHLMEQAQRA